MFLIMASQIQLLSIKSNSHLRHLMRMLYVYISQS